MRKFFSGCDTLLLSYLKPVSLARQSFLFIDRIFRKVRIEKNASFISGQWERPREKHLAHPTALR
jgi:hypothetical protein